MDVIIYTGKISRCIEEEYVGRFRGRNIGI